MFPSPTTVQAQCLLQLTGEPLSRGHDTKKSKISGLSILSQADDRRSPVRNPPCSGGRGPSVHDVEEENQPRKLSLPMLPPVVQHRTVRFTSRVQVRKVTCARHHVRTPADLWYQPEEFQAMRENAMGLMERVAEGETGVGNRKFCTRGLERLSQSSKVRVARSKVLKMVLQLQKVQREHGTVDPEAIAILYRSACVEAVDEAVSLGKQDQEAIKSFMKDIRTCATQVSPS